MGISENAGAMMAAMKGAGGLGMGAAAVGANLARNVGPSLAAPALGTAAAAAKGVGNMSVGSPAASAAASRALAQYLGVTPKDDDETANIYFKAAGP